MSAEEKVEKRITQHLVDNAFSCLDGFGRLTYALDDCRLIQRFLKEAHGVHLSLSECQRFWRWRSELWDASFLAVHDSEASRKEVLDFFGQWLHEMDLWEWPEVEEGDYIDRQACPRCGSPTQTTHLTPPDEGIAYGCTRCSWPTGETP
jgi:hypothetical protein